MKTFIDPNRLDDAEVIQSILEGEAFIVFDAGVTRMMALDVVSNIPGLMTLKETLISGGVPAQIYSPKISTVLYRKNKVKGQRAFLKMDPEHRYLILKGKINE